MIQTVQVGHDKQEVACLLDRKEPGPGHIDAASLLETLHGRPHSGLQLVDADAALQLLGVDDDLHLLQYPLDGRQTDPQVVLNTLNFFADSKSSSCSLETWKLISCERNMIIMQELSSPEPPPGVLGVPRTG